MIEAVNVSKTFSDIKAVDSVTLQIKEGTVFGLIGTNGAGKSTFMRMLSGVIKADRGMILVDDQEVYENPSAKSNIFYISDDAYFFANSTPKDMKEYYSTIYKDFDKARFEELISKFELKETRKINTFSKGMKKQLSLLCGICSGTKYLLCDETFDGLDPVMRQAIKSIFAYEMTERGLTPVIASHNLRELEDICDYVGLLHQGGVMLSQDLEGMKSNIHKIQCVFNNAEKESKLMEQLEIIQNERRGSLITLTVRGNREEILNIAQKLEPVFCEALPLSLEEIFISETEVVGYDIQKLIF